MGISQVLGAVESAKNALDQAKNTANNPHVAATSSAEALVKSQLPTGVVNAGEEMRRAAGAGQKADVGSNPTERKITLDQNGRIIGGQVGILTDVPVSGSGVAQASATQAVSPFANAFSPDLAPHKQSIAQMNTLIAGNNFAAAQPFLTNIINAGMEMGQFKPGHLEAVAHVVHQALAQDGVSPLAKQEILRHFQQQTQGHANQLELASIMNKLQAGVTGSVGMSLDTGASANNALNPAAARREELIGKVLVDPNMKVEQKIATLQSLQAEGNLDPQQMRNIFERQLNKIGPDLVKSLNYEQTLKLRADMVELESEKSPFDHRGRIRENYGFQKALDRHAQELADRKIGETLLSQSLTSTEKGDALRRIGSEVGLDQGDIRSLIGKHLDAAAKDKSFIARLNEQQIRDFQKDIADLGAEYRHPIMGTKNFDQFRDALAERSRVLAAAQNQAQILDAGPGNVQSKPNPVAQPAQAQQVAPVQITKEQAKEAFKRVMGDEKLSIDDKMTVLKKIQEAAGLKDKDRSMRQLIGEAFKEQGTEFVPSLDLPKAQRLQAEMKALDQTFGVNPGKDGMLWENNKLQSELDKWVSALQTEQIGKLTGGLNPGNVESVIQQIKDLDKQPGVDGKDAVKAALPGLIAGLKGQDINAVKEMAVAMGQLAHDLKISERDLERMLEKFGQFSKQELKVLRGQVAAGFTMQKDD